MLLFVGNLVFFPIDNWGTSEEKLEQKFIKGSISGEIFPNAIYTEKEIMTIFPDTKQAKHLHDVCNQWGIRN